MDDKKLLEIVFQALEMINNLREEDSQIEISDKTKLFGNEGSLDSMGLVSFLIDIEESLLDNGIELSLSDERAMSQTRSPFLDVQTVISYIKTLMKENNV